MFEFGRHSYETYVLMSGLFFLLWLLAFGFSIRHAEFSSASVRGEG